MSIVALQCAILLPSTVLAFLEICSEVKSNDRLLPTDLANIQLYHTLHYNRTS